MCFKPLKYNVIVNTFNDNGMQSVNVDPLCNGFVVKNEGNTLVKIMGETILPNASKSVGGNLGEIFEGKIDLYFALPTPAPATPINLCIVTQKVYVKGQL
jgi:hypothetical protein